MSEMQKNRLFELLADDALFGLSGEERMELNRLKKQFPESENDFSVELAAAAVNLTDIDAAIESLPANLRAKIVADADQYFARADVAPSNLTALDDARRASSAATAKTFDNPVQTEAARPSFFGQWLGWSVAAAACAALALNLWFTRVQPQTETAQNQPTIRTPEPTQTPVVETAAQQRERLLASAPDAVKINFDAADVKTLNNLSGDAVWSNSQQKGFVRFRGLPANDARRETYQLWIVDASQNEKTPVSGGVFDVPANGEIVVPIRAQLEIKQPKAIAVSREKPGGVVVSNPQRIVAIGKI